MLVLWVPNDGRSARDVRKPCARRYTEPLPEVAAVLVTLVTASTFPSYLATLPRAAHLPGHVCL